VKNVLILNAAGISELCLSFWSHFTVHSILIYGQEDEFILDLWIMYYLCSFSIIW